MKQYNHSTIEKKTQKQWVKSKVYKTKDVGKKKAYVLDMFPYPSGEGLHVGHPKGYIATDVYSRMRRMQGYSVLHPMGWDAFGLPAENYAIKNKVHPRKAVDKNVKRFKQQLSMIGLDYDWSREVNTTDPSFYKWTQWIFLQLLKKGLAYQSYEPINWCPSCQTGLANEDLEDGKCERCGSVIEKRPMRQWVLKITDYAEQLLNDLELLPHWQESIKESQRNWIGKSEGSEILFPLHFDSKSTTKQKFVLLHGFMGSPLAYTWLKGRLEDMGHEVVVPTLPNPNAPKESEWVEAALSATRYDENTVLFGYSLGAVTALKVLEKLDVKIARLVLAGGFVDAKFADRSRNFEKTFSWSFDVEKIKRNAAHMQFLHDISDTAVSSQQADRLAAYFGVPIKKVQAQKPHFCGDHEIVILNYLVPSVAVFTTRADTLFGATYMVLAPEHPWVTLACDNNHKEVLKNQDAVRAYVVEAKKKGEIERMAEGKEKTGIKLEGVWAINPATREKIPMFVADYTLAHYGTGAVMGVPAHDERDFAFAKKFDIPIREVVVPDKIDTNNPPRADKRTVSRRTIQCVVRNSKGDIAVLHWSHSNWKTLPIGGVEGDESLVDAGIREVKEETGYTNVRFVRELGDMYAGYFASHKGENRRAHVTGLLFDLVDETHVEVTEEEKAKHEPKWISVEDAKKILIGVEPPIYLSRLDSTVWLSTEYGTLVNSGEFSGMTSKEARTKIAQKYGTLKTTYKLRDWVFSRQRYWGEPIPVIHCKKCGVVPVPEKELPVKLPDVKKYEPTGTGESPLAAIDKWVNVKCPQCKGKAKRETNTMPQWAGSSWYYLRYMDPKNKKALVDKKKDKHWSPVDLYVGGAEHATRHLIYARFWHKFLYDIKSVSTKEPFTRLISVGLIQAEDGRKMSKRFGNVINPDDIVKTYGADTLRVYEMFMGPFTDAIAWNTNAMIGSRRFLERVWRIQEKVTAQENSSLNAQLHKTIKKVSEDIETFKFNTAISQMMILVNDMQSAESVGKEQWSTFVRILAPFAPHIAEEMWANMKGKKSVHVAAWPKYNEKYLKQETVTIVVQVQGKPRTSVEMEAGVDEKAVRVATEPLIEKWRENKEIQRVVYVPNRLINYVLA